MRQYPAFVPIFINKIINYPKCNTMKIVFCTEELLVINYLMILMYIKLYRLQFNLENLKMRIVA